MVQRVFTGPWTTRSDWLQQSQARGCDCHGQSEHSILTSTCYCLDRYCAPKSSATPRYNRTSDWTSFYSPVQGGRSHAGGKALTIRSITVWWCSAHPGLACQAIAEDW